MKIPHSLIYLILPLIIFCVSAGRRDPDAAPRMTPYLPQIISPASHGELEELFAAESYDWQTLDERGVPSIILTSLPEDFDRISQPSERKRIFFLSLLPLVLMANEEIALQRQELIFLLESFDAGILPTWQEREKLLALAQEYRVEEDPLYDLQAREILLKRIDTFPPSLVLAQAANESGYGTSRFARQGNNLFGEWTFTPGTGIVPADRPRGSRYEVRRFPTLYDSVRSYMKNINTHRAYRDLRLQRAQLRAEGLPLKGRDLADGLMNYSTRREAYVREIRSIIGRERLSLLASVSLRPGSSFQKIEGSGLLSTALATSRNLQQPTSAQPKTDRFSFP